MLAGCAADPANGQPPADPSSAAASPPASASPTESAAADVPAGLPLRVAVVGDSNTTGHETTLADGIGAGISWIAMVPQTEIRFAGGWAHNGWTSTAMREAATPLDGVDVLVIMAGTNNIARGMPEATLDADLAAIAGTVGATHTVISAIAPFDARPDDAVGLNQHLATLAAANGWDFVDPWTQLRGPDGKWVDQYHADGLHTTKAGYQVMALAMRDALLTAFGPTP